MRLHKTIDLLISFNHFLIQLVLYGLYNDCITIIIIEDKEIFHSLATLGGETTSEVSEDSLFFIIYMCLMQQKNVCLGIAII